MKKYILLICLSAQFLLAQKTVVTYYDDAKSKKKEEFVTDEKGLKNGDYKSYNEAGEIIEEGVYKKGKKNGLFIEYTKFPNFVLKPQVKSQITYVNDLKEGPASYFDFNNDISVYESKKGIYKNDKEDGVWVKITPFLTIFPFPEYQNIKIIPAFRNSMGVKSNSLYKNGEEIMTNGKEVVNYYPSNKLYHSFNYTNGKLRGADLYLYPDGKAWDKTMYSDSGVYMSSEAYYYSGKVKQKEIMEPYFYEGYNEDGSPNKVMLVKINEQLARKSNAAILNSVVERANKLADEGNTLQAMNDIEAQIKLYVAWKSVTFNYSAIEPEELQAARAALERIKQPKKTK